MNKGGEGGTVGELKKLENLPAPAFEQILKNLGVKEKKNLRLVSNAIYGRIQEHDFTFKIWKFGFLSYIQVKQLEDDIEIIQGIEMKGLLGDEDGCNEGVQYLVNKHPDIEKVKIDWSEVSDKGLQSLLSAPCMKSVDIVGSFTGETISLRPNTALYLQKLKLSSSLMTDSGLLNILEGCTPDLKTLHVSSRSLTGEGLKSLQGKFYQLEELGLHYLDKLTNEGVSDLIGMSGYRLKQLKITRLVLNTTVQGRLDHLEILELVSLPNLTNQDYVKFLQNFGKLCNLIMLNLKYCYHLDDERLSSMLNLCSDKLTTLDVSFTKVSGVRLNVLSGKLCNLIELNLDGCCYLTDAGLSSILNLCSDKLIALDVSHTKVSGVGLNVPSGKLCNLTELNLSGCYGLTDAGLSSILNLCSDKLGCLRIGGFDVITQQFKNNVKESRPGLEIIED